MYLDLQHQMVDTSILEFVREVGPVTFVVIIATTLIFLWGRYQIKKSELEDLLDAEDRRILRAKTEISSQAYREADETLKQEYRDQIVVLKGHIAHLKKELNRRNKAEALLSDISGKVDTILLRLGDPSK